MIFFQRIFSSTSHSLTAKLYNFCVIEIFIFFLLLFGPPNSFVSSFFLHFVLFNNDKDDDDDVVIKGKFYKKKLPLQFSTQSIKRSIDSGFLFQLENQIKNLWFNYKSIWKEDLSLCVFFFFTRKKFVIFFVGWGKFLTRISYIEQNYTTTTTTENSIQKDSFFQTKKKFSFWYFSGLLTHCMFLSGIFFVRFFYIESFHFFARFFMKKNKVFFSGCVSVRYG